MSSSCPETVGVVLAGGRSQRMGQDKALLDLSGQPLAIHVAERLAGQCNTVILNSNSDGAALAPSGFPVIADSFSDYRGPLAGILAALDWMAEHRPEIQWLASVAVDTPFFPQDFVAKLHRVQAQGGAQLVMARSGERHHPVNALWSVALRAELRKTLTENDNLKVGLWMRERGAGFAPWDIEPFDPFLNINTPEDFATAQILAR